MAGEKSPSLMDELKDRSTKVGLVLLPFIFCMACGLGPVAGAIGSGFVVSAEAGAKK